MSETLVESAVAETALVKVRQKPGRKPGSKSVMPKMSSNLKADIANAKLLVEQVREVTEDEDDLPEYCQYEAVYKERGDAVFTSHGDKLTDTTKVKSASRVHLTLERQRRDPKTGVIEPKEFSHKLDLPFRSWDNQFVKQDGFSPKDVVRATRALPSFEEGKLREMIWTKEQVKEEQALKRAQRGYAPQSEEKLSPRLEHAEPLAAPTQRAFV